MFLVQDNKDIYFFFIIKIKLGIITFRRLLTIEHFFGRSCNTTCDQFHQIQIHLSFN